MPDDACFDEPRPRMWRNESGGELRVVAMIARPGLAAIALLISTVALGATITFVLLAPSTYGKWAYCGLCFVIGLAGLHGAWFNAFGWCELVFSKQDLTLRQGVGPLIFTKRMTWEEFRKSERVERVDADNGRRMETVFQIFGSRRWPWRFGYSLTPEAADHLWADLSRYGRSSTRVEQVTSAD